MSRRITTIHLPTSSHSGWAEPGEHSAETMIAILRERAAELRKQAEEIERAADHEFQIESRRGAYVYRDRREIQESSHFKARAA